MKKDNKKTYISVISILSTIGLIYCVIMLFMLSMIKPVNKNNSELIAVELGSNRINDVASVLKENNLIKNELAFILRIQLSGMAGNIHSGNYYLSKDMDVNKIIKILSIESEDSSQTVNVKIVEGDTIEDIANKLYDSKVIYDKERFLEECKNGEFLKDDKAYEYLNFDNNNSKYVLEGYLFPDTYEFYYNSKSEDIILKMLQRFNELYNPELQMKATQLGYSTNDVVILASIIQKEGSINDFNKISAVLYNRINKNMYLQVDSSIRYIINKENTIILNEEQYGYDSLYNTYSNKGLIPSPICSPSIQAIEAVLNPEQSFINEEYLYFCTTNSDSNELIFAKTYQEHLNNVKQYKGSWEAYDKTVKSN